MVNKKQLNSFLRLFKEKHSRMSNIFDHAVLSDFLDPGITAASYISQTSNHGNKENLFPGSHI